MQNLLSSSSLSKNLKIKINRKIILPVVLYGCETWLLTLREERRLGMFENRVLRKIFGPKKDEVEHAVALLVEALRYKSEGRGFDSRWCHWDFLLI